MEIVELNLNWKGELGGYKLRRGSTEMVIPIDDRNTDYAILKAKIDSGEITPSPPSFLKAIRTYSSSGVHTGYDTDIGFVPKQPGNRLYDYLASAIATQACIETSRPPKPKIQPEDHVSHLIVCVLFNQPWAHLTEPYAGALSVACGPNSKPEPFSFTLRNIYEPAGRNQLELLFDTHGLEEAHGNLIVAPLAGGVLEIRIPVSNLRKILRGELAVIDSPNNDYLRDLVDMEIVRSGRSKKDGPSTGWHVGVANTFIAPFIADFANRVIEAFWQAYGGIPIGHVSTPSLQRQLVILHQMQSGTKRLGLYFGASMQALNLGAQWQSVGALRAMSDGAEEEFHPLRRPLNRLRMLIEGGFHMEALVLVSSILEVSAAAALAAVVVDEASRKTVQRLGHRSRLELLRKLLNLSGPPFAGGEESAMLDTAFEIYEHRNGYVHELVMPDRKRFVTYHGQRRVVELMHRFSDTFHQDRWFRWLQTISFGGEAVRAVVISHCCEQEKNSGHRVVTTRAKLYLWLRRTIGYAKNIGKQFRSPGG